MKIAKETAVSPAILADRAIAARLFGEFPYGRPQHGSPESIARVDRADLLLARERFLNSECDSGGRRELSEKRCHS